MLKTRDILMANEQDLVTWLKDMKLKELEKHAEKILDKLGPCDYSVVMATVIKAVPELEASEHSTFRGVQDIVKGFISEVRNSEDYDDKDIERISTIIMMIIAKKFYAIHKKKTYQVLH